MPIASAVVEFRLLGPVECESGGRVLPLSRPQERCLLGVLLLDLGRVVPVSRLIELLWDAAPPPRARSLVQTHISRLRAVLRQGDAERYGVGLATHGQGYLADAPPDTVDAHRFRRRVERARRAADPSERAELLTAALGLWRGPALADSATERVREQICAGLDEQRVGASEDLAEAHLVLGRHRDAVADLTDLAARHPLRERLVGLLMLACYRSGQQAQALVAYRNTYRRFVDELGIEPGGELRRLEQAILSHDPALEWPPAQLMPEAGPPRVRPAPVAVSAKPRPGPTAWRGQRSHLTSIVGRDTESGVLASLLSDHRLVTVVGVGGVGKTTLVLHVAEQLGPTLGRDVAVASLVSLRAEDEVILAIADGLDVGGTTAAEALERINRAACERRHLLVLDNCEHLVTACARVVRTMLSACPSLVILATSREPLGLAEETVWRLEPLRVPPEGAAPEATVPAVALFLRRAAESVPGFRATDADLSAVARICRRVDGLPLALELAASTLPALPPGQLADQLDKGFAVLAAGAERRTTLAATLEWSYDLLGERERRLLARLSVFRGGFDAAAAEQVCGDSPLTREEVRSTLASLLDRSLVQAAPTPGPPRYRLLEVVRHYAADRLDQQGEYATVADRHLDHWLTMVRRVASLPSNDDQITAWLTLRADLDNLRAAAEHGYASDRTTGAVELTTLLFDFWVLQETHFAELQRWFDRAEPHLAETLPEVRCLGQLDGAWLRTLHDDYTGALELLRAALPDLRIHHPSVGLEASITEVRAMARLVQPAAPPAAAALFDTLCASPDRHHRLHGVAMLAEAHVIWGRYDEAAELCAESSTEDGGPIDLIRCAVFACLAELGRGHHERAAAYEATLRHHLERPGNFLHMSTAGLAIALRALITTPPVAAVGVVTQLVHELEDRYPPTMARSYGFRILAAEARRRAGQLELAVAELAEALQLSLTRNDYSQILPGVLSAALVAVDLGEPAAAKALARRWDEVRRPLGLPAPLGYADAVAAALDLDPLAPERGASDRGWHERRLRDLVREAYVACRTWADQRP